MENRIKDPGWYFSFSETIETPQTRDQIQQQRARLKVAFEKRLDDFFSQVEVQSGFKSGEKKEAQLAG